MQTPSSPSLLAPPTCRACWAVLWLALLPAQAMSHSALADLSLEQLTQLVVTSVSRKREPLAHTKASVFVITANNIRRSGVTSLAEALRLAPNLHVARANANQYAISARGFNDVLSNKMLVMIDGRTVYSPLFSGVFWEAQSLMLDEIERIEVVSGPNTTVWGSNAVNGHINVITRQATATQGTGLSLQAGTDGSDAAVRHGFTLDNGAAVRVFAHSFYRRSSEQAEGVELGDAAHGVHAGLRADWAREDDLFSLSGDAYESRLDQLPAEQHLAGASLRGRWVRGFSLKRQLLVQTTLAQARRDRPGAVSETLNTVDASAQYRFEPAEGNDMVTGVNLRHGVDDVENTPTTVLTPPDRSLSWLRAFVQNELELSPNISLTTGLSLDRNPYTGWEVQPNLRLGWRMSDSAFFWTALSRAVRAPSRIDRELTQPGIGFIGGPDFRSEVAHVLELGHRGQPAENWSYSATAFVQSYRHLRSVTQTPAGMAFQNNVQGHTQGLDAWSSWRVNSRWRLDGGLALLRKRLHVNPGAPDVNSLMWLGNDPRSRLSLASVFDISPAHSLRASVRHTSRLPDPEVPAWTAVDARWGWRLSRALELSLLLNNLFDPNHAEWGPAANRVEFKRSAALQLRWNL